MIKNKAEKELIQEGRTTNHSLKNKETTYISFKEATILSQIHISEMRHEINDKIRKQKLWRDNISRKHTFLGLLKSEINNLNVTSTLIYKKLKPVAVPQGGKCIFRKKDIKVEGPLGRLWLISYNLKRLNKVSTNKNVLLPTYHNTLQNIIDGVCYGYTLKLKIRGSGYKVIRCHGRSLTLRIGFSHVCRITIPSYINVSCHYKLHLIICESISKSELFNFGNKLKSLRKRNAYRAKGIFEVGEPLPNKTPGKA